MRTWTKNAPRASACALYAVHNLRRYKDRLVSRGWCPNHLKYIMYVYKIFLVNSFEEIITELAIYYVDMQNIQHSGLCNKCNTIKRAKLSNATSEFIKIQWNVILCLFVFAKNIWDSNFIFIYITKLVTVINYFIQKNTNMLKLLLELQSSSFKTC